MRENSKITLNTIDVDADVLADVKEYSVKYAATHEARSMPIQKRAKTQIEPPMKFDLNRILQSAISPGTKSKQEIHQLINEKVELILTLENYQSDNTGRINPSEMWAPYLTIKKEDPIQFLRRVYKKWLNDDLCLADIRRADSKLYGALNNWLKEHDMPDDINLPRKYELHETDPITQSDLEGYRKVLAFKQRQKRRQSNQK